MMEHYEINASRERQCHFLAQVMVETEHLKYMAEKGDIRWHKDPNLPGYKGYVQLFGLSLKPETEDRWYDGRDPLFAPYANDPLGNINLRDAVKFRGRGLLQLTGRDHYARYWAYKGWLTSPYTPYWWSHMVRPVVPVAFPSPYPQPGPEGKKILEAAWAPLWESYWDSVPALTLPKNVQSSWKPADIPDPQKLSIDPELVCDSAGWFWDVYKDLNTVVHDHYADPKKSERPGWDNQVVAAITQVINGGEHGLKSRQLAYTVVKGVLMPDS